MATGTVETDQGGDVLVGVQLREGLGLMRTFHDVAPAREVGVRLGCSLGKAYIGPARRFVVS